MGQNPSEKKQKVIITVRLDYFNKELSQYSPFVERCFEIYDKLFQKHSDIFTDESFVSFLKSLTYESSAEGKVPIFDGEKDFSYEDVFRQDTFINWINDDKNKLVLLNKLPNTNYKYLIKKHKTHDIYIAPVLNNYYAEENIEYIETLVKSIKRDDDIIYLLLHDKDLFDDSKKNHPVTLNNGYDEQWQDCPVLLELIKDNRVFVFQHQEGNDGDLFYKHVIMRLDEITTDDIIMVLERPEPNLLLGKELSKCMRTSKMHELLSVFPNGEYNFSIPFMDI